MRWSRSYASQLRRPPAGTAATTYGRRFLALPKANQPAVLVP